MARKISDVQRLINFGFNAEEAELNQAIESLVALRSNRFPSKKAQARKPRADKGSKRTPPPTDPPANPSTDSQ